MEKKPYPLNKPVWETVVDEKPFCPKCKNNNKDVVMQRTSYKGVSHFTCFSCGHFLSNKHKD